jgi:bifunctional non-homologous end joining protein LigD
MSAEAMPYDIAPMLATPGVLPAGGDWLYEVKWDGVRGLIALDSSSPTPIRITTRLGNDATGAYPEFRTLPDMLGDTAVLLDGEIVAFDQGKPSFNKIQERIAVRGRDAEARALTNPVVFVVFDILHLDGHSTRSLPQRNRRALLEQLPLDAGTSWRLSSVYDDGEMLFESTKAAGLEGIVAKRPDAPYRPGVRSPAWIKIKHNTVDEFVIGGWVPGEGRREQTIGALILGIRSGNDPHSPLTFVGKVGTGFTAAELDRIHERLSRLRRPTRPFIEDPAERTAVWVEPTESCRVEFREWTHTGTIRFPSYKGMVERTVEDGTFE